MKRLTVVLSPSPLRSGSDAGGREAIHPEQAKAMVNRAVEMLREKGPGPVLDAINQEKGPFLDGDLYVFVIGPDHKIAAHAFEKMRVGIPAEELYDVDGQPYGQLMLDQATPKGSWLQYRQFNPVNRKIEKKTSWIVREGDYIFGCGYYEPGK